MVTKPKIKGIPALCLVVSTVLLWSSCTTSFVPDTDDTVSSIVVEGYITAGEEALPPYVLLSRSIGFAQTIDIDDSSDLFISDAVVTVRHRGIDYALTAVCDIPPGLEETVTALLGFSPDSLDTDLCIYVDILATIPIHEGDVYRLDVVASEETVTAVTTIPRSVPLTGFRWDAPPGDPSDTLSRLFITFEDPAGPDYYRYEIATQGRRFVAPLTSVTNDGFFDGSTFEIQLNNVAEPGRSVEPSAFGLYTIGDTITVRWLTMDESHFNFWNTRDFNANSAGPFATYTRVRGNIVGGLGIWGGYYEHQYTLVVE